MDYLPHITIETGKEVTASVIWLHGLGASGHDFEGVIPHLALPEDLAIRFIFPHAPEIPVTVNGGYVMPAWYDILEMGLERKIDLRQIQQSSQAVANLISRETKRGIPSSRIILAGFSQGGAVAYHSALQYPEALGGLLALSTYFATSKIVNVHKANKDLPVHIYHGNQDDVVPEVLGLQARDKLGKMGFSPSYQLYPIGHEVCLEEIKDISGALQAILR